MAGFLFLMLVSVGVLLVSSEAQDDFSNLSNAYKQGVELAVQQVNSHGTIKSHFLFFKSLDKSDIDNTKEDILKKVGNRTAVALIHFYCMGTKPMQGGFGVSYIYHRFYLKATRCPKGTDSNPTKCAFRNDRPLIDCGICYKMYKGEIQNEPKPYVHCIHKPQLTQDLMSARVEHCNKMSYTNGSPTLLAVKNP